MMPYQGNPVREIFFWFPSAGPSILRGSKIATFFSSGWAILWTGPSYRSRHSSNNKSGIRLTRTSIGAMIPVLRDVCSGFSGLEYLTVGRLVFGQMIAVLYAMTKKGKRGCNNISLCITLRVYVRYRRERYRSTNKHARVYTREDSKSISVVQFCGHNLYLFLNY